MKSPTKSDKPVPKQNTPSPVTRRLTREEIDALRKDSKDGLHKMREMEKSMRNQSGFPEQNDLGM
jgi:hypothetical protein